MPPLSINDYKLKGLKPANNQFAYHTHPPSLEYTSCLFHNNHPNCYYPVFAQQ